MRAMTSVPPPAGKPTMTCADFFRVCADARGQGMFENNPVAAAASRWRRVGMADFRRCVDAIACRELSMTAAARTRRSAPWTPPGPHAVQKPVGDGLRRAGGALGLRQEQLDDLVRGARMAEE